MKAADIERMNSTKCTLYVTGTTLKEVMEKFGLTQNVTSEGEPILDGQMYAVAETGTFRVE